MPDYTVNAGAATHSWNVPRPSAEQYATRTITLSGFSKASFGGGSRVAFVASTGFDPAMPANWFGDEPSEDDRKVYVFLVRDTGAVGVRFGETSGSAPGPATRRFRASAATPRCSPT